VHFAPYIYQTRYESGELYPFCMWPCRDKDGNWEYADIMGRQLDKAKFDEWKTIFYGLEGWDPKSGWPTRRLLEQMDMTFVADELQAAGRLGSASR